MTQTNPIHKTSQVRTCNILTKETEIENMRLSLGYEERLLNSTIIRYNFILSKRFRNYSSDHYISLSFKNPSYGISAENDHFSIKGSFQKRINQWHQLIQDPSPFDLAIK